MRALIEIEIKGDFDEPLTNDGIIEVLTDLLQDGACTYDWKVSYQIKKVFKENE